MPAFETNAPRGWMGDAKRGAALGRVNILPDLRTPAELRAAAIAADQHARDADRLKAARRTPDTFAPAAWIEARDYFMAERDAALAAIPAAEGRAHGAVKITLQRVRLNSGGYDSCGSYWGRGAPLYWAASDTAAVEYDATFRASSRDAAKAIVRQTFPNARFYN
jgi:hypothetical protein